MDPKNPVATIAAAWLPRVSGDGPKERNIQAFIGEAAPRERGWTLERIYQYMSTNGCPA